MSCEECRRFEQKLAYHTAPALLGIKPSALMSLGRSELDVDGGIEMFNTQAAKKGLKIKILCECRGRALIFLYNEKLLAASLAEKDRRVMLDSFGYHGTVSEQLERLAERVSEKGDFPHEIGLFLGYPTGDVKGFLKNNGENYILSGCWKVYCDPEKAAHTFEIYSRCRSFLCKRLESGYTIYQALKIS